MSAKKLRIVVANVVFFSALFIPLSLHQRSSAFADPSEKPVPSEFVAIHPIDSHVHAFQNNPEFFAMLKRLNLSVLDICVVDQYNLFRSKGPELAAARAFVEASNGHAKLCTTFDPFPFEKPGFAQGAIADLDNDFAHGAVAVKVWKNIGMQIKKSEGTYLMIDDPILKPILQDIARNNKTLIAHQAEPTSCWEAPNPASPDYDYYKEHPEWYMYLHPDHPAKETILAARDRMLAENPQLRVVGAHLGSMERDVDEIARHLDRYPNFAVDTAARMEYLMLAPREKVRNFLIKYQDRILYGTDLEFLQDGHLAEVSSEWTETYARDWKFLATDETLELQGKKIQGLALPHSVLVKIFHSNAVQWIPGIVSDRE